MRYLSGSIDNVRGSCVREDALERLHDGLEHVHVIRHAKDEIFFVRISVYRYTCLNALGGSHKSFEWVLVLEVSFGISLHGYPVVSRREGLRKSPKVSEGLRRSPKVSGW